MHRPITRIIVAAFFVSAVPFGSGLLAQNTPGPKENKAFENAGHHTDTIDGPAGRLHIDDGGTGGIPIVFVHSFAGGTSHWSAQLAHLRKSHRAIAFDLRGHGQSERPGSNDYTIESLAGDIGAVVDSLGLKRFVLVGHSMGSEAAAAYAGMHPERVAGLLLAGAPGKIPAEVAEKVMADLRTDYEKTCDAYWKTLLAHAQPKVGEKVRAAMKSVPQDQTIACISAIFTFDPVSALKHYHGPTLLVDTPQDKRPGTLHSQMPEIPLKIISGTSHWFQMDKPREFNRILDEFVLSVPAEGAL